MSTDARQGSISITWDATRGPKADGNTETDRP
jgi:hypothetical protein